MLKSVSQLVSVLDVNDPIPDQTCGAQPPTKSAKSANFVMKSYRKLSGFEVFFHESWGKVGWFLHKGVDLSGGCVAEMVWFHKQNGKIGKIFFTTKKEFSPQNTRRGKPYTRAKFTKAIFLQRRQDSKNFHKKLTKKTKSLKII